MMKSEYINFTWETSTLAPKYENLPLVSTRKTKTKVPLEVVN
jgi:hypothetical protein